MKPISVDFIRKVFPQSNLSLVEALVPHLQEQLPHFLIDTELEICHFLAQAAKETDSFKSLTEYASGENYEGRQDLGNTQPGDGRKFRGHGIFMDTGRANHAKSGKSIFEYRWFGPERLVFANDAVLENPLLLTEPKWAVASACFYWNRKDLSSLCVEDNEIVSIRRLIKGKWVNYRCSPIEGITRKVNGGMNGFKERKDFYLKLRQAIK